jgi:hypothetical protein
MKEGSSGEASLVRDSITGTLGGGPLLGNTKDEVFERYAKCPVGGPLFLQGPCSGTWRGSFAGTFERKEKYIWVPFLDPEATKFKFGGHLELW